MTNGIPKLTRSVRYFLSNSIALLLPFSLCADTTVMLKNGNRLTGEIQQLSENGECHIQLTTTSSPVTIKPGKLEYIKFAKHKEEGKHHTESVTLINGDILPCQILKLKEDALEVDTSYGGSFSIPKKHIHSLGFNNTFEPILYEGPNLASEWAQLTQWKLGDRKIQTEQNAEASLHLPLTTNFSISFRAKWDGDRPRFKLYLASDHQRKSDIKNCYSIDFNSSSIQVYRASSSRPKQRIGEIPIRLRERSRRAAQIEVKVDRKLQQISIHIDGNRLGVFDDTEMSPPIGNWTILESNMQNENLTISDICVKEQSDNFFSTADIKDKTAQSTDRFYDKEGLSYSGKLLKITKGDDTTNLHFKSKHSSTPLVVPIRFAHSLYLAENKLEKVSPANYLIELHGGGKLHISSLSLNAKNVLSTHPLLGKLTLTPNSLSSVTKTSNTNAK